MARNVEVTRKGNVLTITVNLAAEKTPSGSGRTLIVASTEGNQKIEGPGGFSMGLNVYTKEGLAK